MENNEYKEIELDECILESAAGGQEPVPGQLPGLKCPQCGGFIETTIQIIINSTQLVCPHCGLRLNISRTSSKKAIDALKKVQEAQANIEIKDRSED